MVAMGTKMAFSSLARILAGRFDDLFPACAFVVVVIVVEVEITMRSGSIHSGSVSRDDSGRFFPDE